VEVAVVHYHQKILLVQLFHQFLLFNGSVTIGKSPLVANFNEPVFNAAQGAPDSANMVLTLKGSTTPLAGTVQQSIRVTPYKIDPF